MDNTTTCILCSVSNHSQLGNNTINWKAPDVFVTGCVFIVLCITSTITVVGNTLVLHAMAKTKRLRTPINYFIFSLALSDLLSGLVYPIYVLSHVNLPQIRGTLGLWPSCQFLFASTLGLQLISTYNLVGITLARYISIRDPLKFPLRFTHRLALIGVISTWVILGSIRCATFLVKKPENYTGECRSELLCNDYDVINTAVFYVFLPLIIMGCLYGHMIVIARKQIRTIAFGPENSQVILRRELRMFKMISLLIGYFAFAWLPLTVLLFSTLSTDVKLNEWIRGAARVMLHSNTAVNVFIYAGSLRSFRESIKSSVRGTFHSCRAQAQE